MIKNNNWIELQKSLNQSLHRHGLLSFITEILTPLNAFVGEAWSNGELANSSRTCIYRNPAKHAPPRDRELRKRRETPPKVLLATIPKEHHSIGLLMVEAALAIEGVLIVFL